MTSIALGGPLGRRGSLGGSSDALWVVFGPPFEVVFKEISHNLTCSTLFSPFFLSDKFEQLSPPSLLPTAAPTLF